MLPDEHGSESRHFPLPLENTEKPQELSINVFSGIRRLINIFQTQHKYKTAKKFFYTITSSV